MIAVASFLVSKIENWSYLGGYGALVWTRHLYMDTIRKGSKYFQQDSPQHDSKPLLKKTHPGSLSKSASIKKIEFRTLKEIQSSNLGGGLTLFQWDTPRVVFETTFSAGFRTWLFWPDSRRGKVKITVGIVVIVTIAYAKRTFFRHFPKIIDFSRSWNLTLFPTKPTQTPTSPNRD